MNPIWRGHGTVSACVAAILCVATSASSGQICGEAAIYFDMSRNGVTREAADLGVFRQMLSGAIPATRSWVLETIGPQP